MASYFHFLILGFGFDYMGIFAWRVGEDSLEDITIFSWSRFEGIELLGENKGREDVKTPWNDEARLQLRMTRNPPTTRFLME